MKSTRPSSSPAAAGRVGDAIRSGFPILETATYRNGRLIDGPDELGASVVTLRDPRRRGPLVCVRSTDAHVLVESLAGQRVIVSSRDASVRIAVDHVVAALTRNRHLLA